jgi:LacI family transcriptional regulator
MSGKQTGEDEPRASLRQVADRAGVALSSASRVLAGHPGVTPALERRVLDAAAELDYEPNLLAQSLRSGASLMVGFVVRDISSPLLSRIALGAERVLKEAGYSLTLSNSEGLPSSDAEYIRFFRRRRADGVLLSLSDETSGPTLDELRRLRQPVVLIDRDTPDVPGLSAVLSDHQGGITLAAQHLVQLGHRRIGLAGAPLTLRPGRESARALETFCRSRPGLSALVECGPLAREHGEAAVSRMLRDADPPTAIVAGNLQILIGVLRALESHRLRVPGDVSVVAFDDGELLDFVSPPITAVLQQPLTIGQLAAGLLLRRLAGGEPEQTVVPTTLRVRASCGPPGG